MDPGPGFSSFKEGRAWGVQWQARRISCHPGVRFWGVLCHRTSPEPNLLGALKLSFSREICLAAWVGPPEGVIQHKAPHGWLKRSHPQEGRVGTCKLNLTGMERGACPRFPPCQPGTSNSNPQMVLFAPPFPDLLHSPAPGLCAGCHPTVHTPGGAIDHGGREGGLCAGAAAYVWDPRIE